MTNKYEADLKRVSMVWPAELKEQVRGLVGSRGLTDFTLDAVRDKLAQVASMPSEPEPEPAPAAAEPPAEPVAADEGPDPAEMAKLPLAERMKYARSLMQGRVGEPTAKPAAPQNRCPKCHDELVNGECWTCPPTYGAAAQG